MSSDVLAQWAEYRADPCGFVARFWPHVVLADHQIDILYSVVDNVETWVQSANEVGKSFVSALAAIWWFATRRGIVITISPSEDQLRDVLWQEITNLLNTATLDGQAFDFGFARNYLDIRHTDEAGVKVPKCYLVGKCVSKDQSLAGAHLPTLADGTPTILFIAEEVSAINDKFWHVIRTSRHRLLAIGNPVTTAGEMYQVCSRGDQAHPTAPGKLWTKVVRVSAEMSPNVVAAKRCLELGRPLPKRTPVPGLLSYEEYLNRRATYPPWQARPSLDGLFNDESTAKLFPKEALDFGQSLFHRLQAGAPDRRESPYRWLRWWGWPFGIGVDCAMGGGDLSAWAIYGRFGCVHVETLDTPNTRAIKRQTLSLMRHWRIQPEWVCFDRAIGKGIADELREEGREVNDAGFGESALDSGKYPNMRVELYGDLAEAMAKAFDQAGRLHGRYEKLLTVAPSEWRKLKKARPVALPPDADLRQELFVLPRARDGRDRLTLPPKDGTKSKLGVKQMLGGRSPDRADALVLARYAWERGQEHRRLSRIKGPLAY